MARRIALILIASVAVCARNPHTIAEGASRTRVYATFVSHNEESFSNPPCAAMLASRDRYVANRAAVVSLARLVAGRGATWDVQSEWEYLTKVAAWDDEAARDATNGQNVIQFLAEIDPAHVAVDAHSH